MKLLIPALRSNPGSVQIGFNRRYHPLVRRVRARLLQESWPGRSPVDQDMLLSDTPYRRSPYHDHLLGVLMLAGLMFMSCRGQIDWSMRRGDRVKGAVVR